MSEASPSNMLEPVMRREIARRRISSFAKRFGQAHLFLAYHAAFPLALTPDLLYRLWANFQHDMYGMKLHIPWLAVADFLLSSLCDEVGYEIYEMNVAVRNALLSDLAANQNFGKQRIDELSDFLLAYVKQQLDSHDSDIRDFAEAQQWTALAYTRPGNAAHELALALRSSLEKDDKAEQVRIASLIESFAEPLAEFVPLLTYARGMKHYVYGNEEKAAEELSEFIGSDAPVSVLGVDLQIPRQLLENNISIFERNFASSDLSYGAHQGRFRGSLQGVGLDELLGVMEMNRMSGILQVEQTMGRVGNLYFLDGKLAACSEIDAEALILGDILQQLGLATRSQIEQAFSQQLQDPFGKRIGERLINMGAITQGQLNEALRTKALWVARELALWREGTFEFFQNSDVRSTLPYCEEPLEIVPMGIQMEMVRYHDEWEVMNHHMPQGMRTKLAPTPTPPLNIKVETLDKRSIELLVAAHNYQSVRRIATAVQRPELDVAHDLALLSQQGLLQPTFQEVTPPMDKLSLRLPNPAEKFRMDGFAFLALFSRMEQDWQLHSTPVRQLPTLAKYINWAMDALADECQKKGTQLGSHTLEYLLSLNNLRFVGNYLLLVNQNHIDVNNFAALCEEVLKRDIIKSVDFYEESLSVLSGILRCIFQTINSRVAYLAERLENQEVWRATLIQLEVQGGRNHR